MLEHGQQLFGLGLVGKGNAGPKQLFQRGLRVGGASDAIERDREVIGDRGIGGRRGAGGGQIRHRLAGIALGHQNPAEGVVDLGGVRRSRDCPLRQTARLVEIALLLIEPRQIVQDRRIGGACSEQLGVFAGRTVVILV